MKLSPEHLQLWKAVQKILWEDWDPIGVNNSDGGPDDEYNGYVPKIYQLKVEGATEGAIMEQLLRDEEHMGLTANYNRCKEIAKKIIDIKFQ